MVDRSDGNDCKLQYLGVDAVISIGGDGSQRISQQLYEKRTNIIGVPNHWIRFVCNRFYFGFQTAVQITTEALVDRLVTTAASHNRVLVLEGWEDMYRLDCFHAAIAGRSLSDSRNSL